MKHRSEVRRRSVQWAISLSTLCLAVASISSAEAAEHAATVNRISSDIRNLSSDEMEGRGPGTEGLEKAAQYIRTSFENLGLRGAGNDGAYLRPFSISLGAKVVEASTYLILRGPDGQELKLELGEQFQPLATTTVEQMQLDVVFAGYGISAPELGYDDYQGVDVKGKAVIVLRREPQQADAKSVFDGIETSSFSYIRTKTRAAAKAGAAAILLVNDPFTTQKEQADQLSPPGGFGRGNGNIPFLHVKQAVVAKLLEQTPLHKGDQQLSAITAIEADIDQHLTPMTQPLVGWKAEFQCTFDTSRDDVSNIAAVIEGEGPLAAETIVIGAHYDHLGFGPYGSRRPHARAVHNGADDNASGTAAIIELARRFSSRAKKPARRLVFIAFTAEERGILGSNYYLKDPLFPLDQTVAMINLDMIGHLDTGGLSVGGVGSAKEFGEIIERLSKDSPFEVKTITMNGGSDHAGFYRRNIPFMFFHTGMTELYHTPDDDFETIDIDGTVAAIDFSEKVLDEVINLAQRPEFTKVANQPRVQPATAYLGVVPDYSAQELTGVKCTEVNPDSPAAEGGLQSGDVIVKIGDVAISDMRNLTAAMRKFKAGDQVQIIVRRNDSEQTLDVTLGKPGG